MKFTIFRGYADRIRPDAVAPILFGSETTWIRLIAYSNQFHLMFALDDAVTIFPGSGFGKLPVSSIYHRHRKWRIILLAN